MNTSAAVPFSDISRVIGYDIQKSFNNPSNPFLPQRITVLAEANHANQSGLTSGVPVAIQSAADAGNTFGYGSPAHIIARLLFPIGGTPVNCPVFIQPQLESDATSPTDTSFALVVSGSFAKAGTVYITVNGRNNIDGQYFAINITSSDTTTSVANNIVHTINAVIGSPISASATGATVNAISKWYGLTSADLEVAFVDNLGANGGAGSGFTIAISSIAGTGTPAITNALNNFGNTWNTLVINSYGLNATIITALQNFNGKPSPTNPAGRYAGIIMKPFIALSGTVLDATDIETFLSTTYINELTISVCPACLSQSMGMEVAAAYTYLFANQLVNEPILDIAGQILNDIMPPVLGANPTITDYNTRNTLMLKGSSTCNLVNNQYMVMDFVTTYIPVGELPPIFQYCRDILGIDMNIYYYIQLVLQQSVWGKVIVKNDSTAKVDNVVRPKDVVSVLVGAAKVLADNAIIADSQYMIGTIQVAINSNNPKRLDIQFAYQRSGTIQIIATNAYAGFNFTN